MTGYLSVNGFLCVRGRISLPLVGAWVADVVAEPDDVDGSFPGPGSAVTMTIGEQGFSGVVRRASSPFGTVFARLIGGAGGLPTQLDAKSYQNTTVQNVLEDILDDCGETLASNSDQGLMAQPLPFWVRMATPGWQALSMLIRTVTAGAWRVLPNGTIWVGVDTYPGTSLESFELLSYLPQELRAEIYSDNPTLLPGQAFLGGNVSGVEHAIEPARILTRVLFNDAQLSAVVSG